MNLLMETSRLVLRPFTVEDATIMYALNSDPEVLKYTGDKQFESIAETRRFLEAYDQYQKYKVGRLIVISKEDKEIVGWCGLKFHPDTGDYDLGYRFFQKHWGKGYASEAARACITEGFESLKLNRIIGRVRKENSNSIRVLRKLGMQHVEDYLEDAKNWQLFELTASMIRY